MSKKKAKSIEQVNGKCREILIEIVERCNKGTKGDGWQFAFGPDWGGYSLTLYDRELGGHTHVGDISEAGTFDDLIEQLHGQLIIGRGLTWAADDYAESPGSMDPENGTASSPNTPVEAKTK